MYIEPNTTVLILKDCPLDPSYDHTLYWESEEEQVKYFQSIRKYRLDNLTYQRVQRGTVRVKIKAENLYDCNYIMFQNTSFGTKWFYAFIKAVEYVNNTTSEITFELDVMQTWHFQYNLGQCFVEREHTETDNIGEHTIPEELETGELITNEAGTIKPNNYDPQILLLTTFNPTTYEPFGGCIRAEVFNSLYYSVVRADKAGADSLQMILERIVKDNKADGVIAIYMCPFNNQKITGEGAVVEPEVVIEAHEISKNYGALNGYKPKNNKLFTYPFNYLKIYNDSGEINLKYELFPQENCIVGLFETANPDPVITLAPSLYAGIEAAETPHSVDPQLRLTSTAFPICAWNNDVYARYLAQNQVQLGNQKAMAMIGAAVGIGGAFVAGGPVGVMAGIGSVLSLARTCNAIDSKKADMETKAPQQNGAINSSADYAIGFKNFMYKKMALRPEYARVIDDYFTMFGYACHRVKTPNRSSRPHWNYVKTVGCVLTGSIPADDVSKICDIYNNGITFWKSGKEIGDYTLDNSPQ